MTGPRPHALVVGGTGMLRTATFGLVARGWDVSLVGRNPLTLDKFRDAAEAAGGLISPVCVDWRDEAAFAFGLDAAVAGLGPPSLALVWSHASAPDAPYAVARLMEEAAATADYFHVLGSATADPSRPDDGRLARFAALREIRYHEVILGFVRGPRGSRWLTDAEISGGVLAAIDAPAPRTVVGTVEPWSDRP